MAERKRILQGEVVALQASRKGGALVSMRGDSKVYEYKAGVEMKSIWVEGEKRVGLDRYR